MKLKRGRKFGEESTYRSKVDIILTNFDKFDKFRPEHLKVSKNFRFNGLLLSKVYIV